MVVLLRETDVTRFVIRERSVAALHWGSYAMRRRTLASRARAHRSTQTTNRHGGRIANSLAVASRPWSSRPCGW